MRLLLVFALLSLSCCQLLEKYPDDNVFEEIAEEVIRSETGLDLDLSAFSTEKG